MVIHREKNQQALIQKKKEILERIKAISIQMGNVIDTEIYQEPYVFQQIENLNSYANTVRDINRRLFELGRS